MQARKSVPSRRVQLNINNNIVVAATKIAYTHVVIIIIRIINIMQAPGWARARAHRPRRSHTYMYNMHEQYYYIMC